MSRISTFLLTFFLLAACTKKTPVREVNLAIWANYLSVEMMEKFTKETGIQVRISNYSSNEELLGKIQAGASGFDVAVPSDYMVDQLRRDDLLMPLQTEKILNRKGLDPRLLKQSFDPENRFSFPYAWITTGFAYRKDLVDQPLKSWKEVFSSNKLKGKVSLLDDVRETMAIALLMNRLDINSTAADDLKKAKETLRKAKPWIQQFTSDTIDILANKEVAVAHSYSSDALQAGKKTDGQVVFVLPEEGGTTSMDNLVILKTSSHVAEAHELINFMLSQEANLSFVQNVLAGPVLLTTREHLKEDLRQNAALFPSEKMISALLHLHDLGSAIRDYDRVWTEIKSD